MLLCVQQAMLDNERRRKLEAGMLQPDMVQPNKKKEKKMTQVRGLMHGLATVYSFMSFLLILLFA